MANPELAIAKASFSALLFRKEPVSLTRQEIEAFHTLLHDAIHQCSPANVQKCKRWILKNTAPSAARVAALGKYLAALSNSFSDKARAKPSTRRRRLHVLYILNDVLYHVVARDRDAHFATQLEASLTPLLHGAARFRNCPKHTKKLEALLALWEKHAYFSATTIDNFRGTVKEAPHGGELPKNAAQDQTGSNLGSKLPKDAPYMIPSIHGDPNTPWFDLPASNWLPHLTPNSTKPINPDMIKPLQLAQGPADKALAKAVKDLLVDVERLYSKGMRPQTASPQQHTNLSEMGERVVLDEITHEVVDGKTYYGWSRRFCEKMKQRRQKAQTGADGRGRSRSDLQAAQDLARFSRSQSQSQLRPFSATQHTAWSLRLSLQPIQVKVELSLTSQVEIAVPRSRPERRNGSRGSAPSTTAAAASSAQLSSHHAVRHLRLAGLIRQGLPYPYRKWVGGSLHHRTRSSNNNKHNTTNINNLEEAAADTGDAGDGE
ncbi:hypothetical protein CTA2_10085, partial [Colletotrichum tanaceti]